jgi:hypothetical protein
VQYRAKKGKGQKEIGPTAPHHDSEASLFTGHKVYCFPLPRSFPLESERTFAPVAIAFIE